ncbi:MAG TPA: hypothetical protein VI759_07300 [Dehalococcoidia bacterium]|nr:hypothetical protein [Dehalococcoidia bacterium]
MSDITIAELVRNGTMSAEIAAVLWAAVDERLSFLTVAIPRFAGKTTTSNAVLAMRPPHVPASLVHGHAQELEALRRERRGGYIVVPEFAQAPVPGYIWGEPVRRVFETVVEGGYSLQTALHAGSVEDAIAEVSLGNRVPDDHASTFKLVIYIERFGGYNDFWRRVTHLYEVERIENGRPVGHSLFRWQADGDKFVAQTPPQQFARDATDLARRANLIAELAATGRTSGQDVANALQSYRERT